jgi:Fe-S cluster biosynthesis and repair protein YggX
MDIETRIAQFENMASADPENDMAHFSLGGAYAQAERWAEAAGAYLKAVEVNPDMSKARQLGAECLEKAGETERAAEVAAEGYVEAAKRGDLMPRDAMGSLLERLGREIPTLDEEASAAAAAAPTGGFVCVRTGRPGTQMAEPPFRGPVGEWIHQNIAAETWREWIGQGTKVINELRLDLSQEKDAETFDQHMREFLGIDDDLYERLTTVRMGESGE